MHWLDEVRAVEGWYRPVPQAMHWLDEVRLVEGWYRPVLQDLQDAC